MDERNVPSCTCKHGTYRCHHMAVTMLNAYRSVSSTDKTCVCGLDLKLLLSHHLPRPLLKCTPTNVQAIVCR